MKTPLEFTKKQEEILTSRHLDLNALIKDWFYNKTKFQNSNNK